MVFCAGLALGFPNISSPSPKWRTVILLEPSQRPSSFVGSVETWHALAPALQLTGQQAVPALSSRSLHTGSGPALARSHLSETQWKKKEHTH